MAAEQDLTVVETTFEIISPFVPAPMQAVLAAAGIGPPVAGAKDRRLQWSILEALLDEVSRLHRLLIAHEGQLLRTASLEEVQELCLQTLSNYTRTFNREKRSRMTNVLVNGLALVDAETTARRHFVRAVAELDTEHVDLLRHAVQQGTILGDRGSVTWGLLEQLSAWGFVYRDHETMGRFVTAKAEWEAIEDMFHGHKIEAKPDLGEWFLRHLAEPE